MVAAVVAAVASSFAAETVAFYVGSTIGSSLVGYAVGAIAGAVVGSEIRSALSDSPASPGQQSAIARASGILLNTASNVEPISVIYGSRRVGGAYALREVSGASNEYYHIVLALCEGEISAINTVYLDDVPITDPRFAGLVTVEKYLGSDTQAASAALQAELPGKWTAAHTLSGVAYVYIKLKYDPNAFTGEPTITCDVDGKRVYDPRDGLTKFTNNPSLCIRDYLTNVRYGRGIPASAIDDVKFAVAANYCDQLVSTPSGTQKRYTCDGVVNTADSTFSNYKLLLTACRGMPVFSGGKHSVIIDAPAVAGFEFSEDNIVGRWTIKLSDKKSRYNRLRANFFNPDTHWQPDIWPEDAPALRALDNGCLLEGQIDLPFTANRYTAQQLSQMALAQSRFGTVCQFTATIAGMRCEVGDVANITHSTPGWTAKPFRIMRIALLSSDEVEVTCREYDGSVFALNPLTAPAQSPTTNLPNPFNVAAPTNPILTSGTTELLVSADGTIISRIKAAWIAASDVFVRSYEVNWKKSADAAWQSQITNSPVIWLSPVDDGAAYDVRVRSENAIGVRSAWATAPAHTVVGKTAPPADVTGFSVAQNGSLVLFRCNPSSESDFSAVDVYCNPVGVTTLSGDPVATMSGSSFTTADVQPGSWTFMAVARDTTGNLSAIPARCDLTVSNGHDIIQQTEHGQLWAGCTLTHFVRHWTGVLIPQGQSAVSTQGWETFEPGAPDPYPDCYLESPEIDLAFDCAARLWASWSPGSAGLSLEADWKLAAGAYAGFRPWSVGDVTARYVKFRLHLNTALGQSAISGFQTTADALEFAQTGSLTIAAGGTAITWPIPYHFAPSLTVKSTGGTALIPGYTNRTPTGAILHLFNLSGTSAGGSGGWDTSGV